MNIAAIPSGVGNPELGAALLELIEGRDLSESRMKALVLEIMTGGVSDALIASLLTALRLKPEAASEITGTARAMYELATRIPVSRTGLLDTCGTGGDELSTFNISTATALVVAACGIPVAKHGNRSVSSSSGSADVLETLGVNVQLTPEQVGACIDKLGIGFCFAPLFHQAMKHVGPVRKQLRFRTIFNLVGPLVNPAGAQYQLLGVGRLPTAGILAESLRNLGRTRALVVCGAGMLDEVALWDETTVYVIEGDLPLRELKWTSDTFGLPSTSPDQLRVDSPAESAALIRRIFSGEKHPGRNIVLANAAAAMVAAGTIPLNDLPAGVTRAAMAIDSGKVAELLQNLASLTQGFVQS